MGAVARRVKFLQDYYISKWIGDWREITSATTAVPRSDFPDFLIFLIPLESAENIRLVRKAS